MLRWQFLCHVLKALFFIKIALKLSYICKKMQNLRALGASPKPLCLRWLETLPPDPQNGPPPLRVFGYAPDTWLVSETTHLLYYFLITIHKFTSTSPVFTNKILFKKNQPWKMLIEQIVELQWREPGPRSLTCTSITGYFHDITKISEENLRVGFHLLLKC